MLLRKVDIVPHVAVALKRSKSMSRRSLLFGIVGLGILVLVSFVFGGVLGLIAGIAISLFVIIEMVYYYGARGSLLRSFRSNISSDVPDAQISNNIRSPRGFHDLDYRGRGKN